MTAFCQRDRTLYHGMPFSPCDLPVNMQIPDPPGYCKWWVTTFADAPGYCGGKRVGTLHAGKNYVWCTVEGPEVRDNQGNYNHWWLYTVLLTCA